MPEDSTQPSCVLSETSKPLWRSKTFWANVIALFGLVLQHYTGYQLDGTSQVELLAGLDILLRALTKTAIA